jgi:hypothetical protein
MSGSKINRIEAAEIGIYQDDLEMLLDYYDVTRKQRLELTAIARNAEQRGCLRMRNPHLPDDSQTWCDIEDEATALSQYEPMMIPGLLQTAEYARAITIALGNDLSEREIEALVSRRLAGQSLLTKERPVLLHAIVEESVLSRPLANEGASARQLRHLIDTASRPNVTLQVLPIEAGLHPGLGGAFAVVQYDDEPSLVCLENTLMSTFVDEDSQIEAYTVVWDKLLRIARPAEESIEILRKLIV